MERLPTLDEFDGSMVRQLPRGPDGFVVSMYEAHHAEVYAFLVRSTRDPSAAEDLLQETFLRLTTEARAGRAPEQVRAWLFRVASNLAISRARRHATANTYMDRFGQPTTTARSWTRRRRPRSAASATRRSSAR